MEGKSFENDMEIDEISPPIKKNCFQILNELSHKFDIGVPLYRPCDYKDSTNSLQLDLNHWKGLVVTSFSGNYLNNKFKHFITDVFIYEVIGSGGTRKEAKNDAARKLLLEMKKATREGRTLISGVPKEEFVACCEW